MCVCFLMCVNAFVFFSCFMNTVRSKGRLRKILKLETPQAAIVADAEDNNWMNDEDSEDDIPI